MASIPKPMFDAGSLEVAVQTLQERLDLLQATLTQQQRLATLGMVTSVIAHEFNNILTPMISYTRYAVSTKSDDELREKALAKALNGAEKLAAISQSLLGFARGDPSMTALVRTAIQETLTCLSRDLSKDGITLTIEAPDDLVVAMNAGQFQQVLMNLIVNARAALIDQRSRGGRRLTIRATRVQRRGGKAGGSQGGGRAVIEITDSGPGIDPEVLPHIFEPFFSTKRYENQLAGGAEAASGHEVPRGGTGLGLTICRELVQAAGGELRVESKWGQKEGAGGTGTSFFIELPVADAPVVN